MRHTEAVCAAFTILARCNIPPDVQELLVYGDAKRGIAPRALERAIEAVLDRTSQLPTQ